MTNFTTIQSVLLSDENLYHLCKTYGGRALLWRQKFIGLLPEVNRRRLYEKKGFGSIFIFAYKLAGLSEEQVRRALNVEKKFENLPSLKTLLINGEVSLNKLARVASVANLKNEEFLATQVKILSQGAVETLVRDEKINEKILNNQSNNPSATARDQNGLFESNFEVKSVRTHTSTQLNSAKSINQKFQILNLSFEVHQKLLDLQQKGFDINQLILEFLQKRELEIAQKKEQVRKKILQKEEYSLQAPRTQTRHIPIAAKKIIHEEFGTKCSVKNCRKLSAEIHHTLPFAIGKTHDPKFLVPLCKEHHELEHAINYRYNKMRAAGYVQSFNTPQTLR